MTESQYQFPVKFGKRFRMGFCRTPTDSLFYFFPAKKSLRKL